MRRKLVVGNWKMNGNLAQNKTLLDTLVRDLRGIDHADFAVCVPYPYLFQAQAILSGTNIAWGAQNIAKHGAGAYTGEVSAAMLKEFDSSYVIIGHSERSNAYCESDANIASKFAVAKGFGITPIFCVGETLQERESGVMEYAIANQLDFVLSVSGGALLDNAVVAYEPVWAIGTNKTATPEQAQAAHSFIRERISALHPGAAESVRIIYGGSVNPINAAQLLSMPDIDGGLIGRCSLDAADFERICRAACQF
ncbi:triose-phosphate isomerase [Methylobacillus gramineus]|uniref:triose-phosphate isomerase n=1 Tax=Methylobacillus gramineus TaxID=755169 RepID=UPI001CFFBCBE|nr:triose-phosphate isomerase [Methylobacillus gramineus]MCB5183643.1 triose-phosphate isomerase [Methylobacillus gramineus]